MAAPIGGSFRTERRPRFPNPRLELCRTAGDCGENMAAPIRELRFANVASVRSEGRGSRSLGGRRTDGDCSENMAAPIRELPYGKASTVPVPSAADVQPGIAVKTWRPPLGEFRTEQSARLPPLPWEPPYGRAVRALPGQRARVPRAPFPGRCRTGGDSGESLAAAVGIALPGQRARVPRSFMDSDSSRQCPGTKAPGPQRKGNIRRRRTREARSPPLLRYHRWRRRRRRDPEADGFFPRVRTELDVRPAELSSRAPNRSGRLTVLFSRARKRNRVRRPGRSFFRESFVPRIYFRASRSGSAFLGPRNFSRAPKYFSPECRSASVGTRNVSRASRGWRNFFSRTRKRNRGNRPPVLFSRSRNRGFDCAELFSRTRRRNRFPQNPELFSRAQNRGGPCGTFLARPETEVSHRDPGARRAASPADGAAATAEAADGEGGGSGARAAMSIVHDPSEAEPLCPALGLYLKPITKLAISVALPPLRPPGKSISNWEVMERLKAMVAGAGPDDVAAAEGGGAGGGAQPPPPLPHAQFSSLRIAKSTLDFIRFEAEVEQRALVRPFLARLDGRSIKLAGFADPLRVRAAEFRPDAPSRHDWDAFFRDAADMNETRPGERPDTIHLEGLPCRWFAPRGGGHGEATSASTSSTSARSEATSASTSASTSSTSARSEATSASTPSSTSARSEATSSATSASTSSTSARSEATSSTTSASTFSASAMASSSLSAASERPSEALLRQAFAAFGEIRQVDIPMLDPYREDMTGGVGGGGVGGGGGGRGFHTFGWGGGLHFEAYVQYREYAGFVRAMAALRGAKLMYKGEDGKAVACGIKVSFDATKHLSEASIRRRQLERQKLRELELQREEQKRREREAEERRRAEERKQKQLEQQQRERRREEKLRRREQRARDREQRRSRRRAEKLQAEEQRRLQEKIRTEERKLLLAQRNLQSIRLVAELLGRVEAAKLQQRERSEERRRRQRQEERRRLQEAELRRVEEEKARALGLQRRERELRQRLLSLLLSRRPDADAADASNPDPADADPAAGRHAGAADDLLRPVLDILHRVTHARAPPPPPPQDSNPDPKAPATATAPTQVLACIRENAPPKPGADAAAPPPPPLPPRDRGDHDKCNREPECERRSRSRGDGNGGERPRQHRKRAHADGSEDAEEEDGESRDPEREPRRQRQRRRREKDEERGRERKRSRHGRRSRSRSRSPRRRSAWNR
ncbi:uncharacterized protein LOC142842039 [Microtus pennsylvanicus]|uniref:uncharacterized protein LOC142842039 n=1 Tax=Microtus pennsylvanicus TaxID=10058 RepID=UPI003F6B15C8